MPISEATLGLINAFKSPLITILSDIKDEVEFVFETGISSYVDSIKDKYSKTKTFLYRLENVDFYEVYFPISLTYNTRSHIQIENIDELFRKSNYISIIGNAGSGKSMLLKHVFLSSLMQVVKIPIVLELRNINDYDGTFFEYLENLLIGKNLTPNAKILHRILLNGQFIFLLDGYDEIFSENKNKITSELIEFIDNYSKNYFLITSRPGANIESLPRFENYKVNSLSKNEVDSFIKLQLNHCEDSKLEEKIISVVKKPENKDYNSYLSSPLLLSMFIMTFNSYPELPRSKNKFYWNVFDTLCTKHDSFTKHGGFQHERKTGLQNDDFEEVLKWFSYNSLFSGKYSFDDQYFTILLSKVVSRLNIECNINFLKEDLIVAISIIVIDGLEFRFPHKSLQEYFSALLIKEQSEDIKREIYIEKFKLLDKSNGRDDNFWNICQELDYIPFVKYFILRHLNGFIDKIDFTDDNTICQSVLTFIGLHQTFFKESPDSNYLVGGVTHSIPIEFSVIEYMKLGNILDIGFIRISMVKSLDNEINELLNKGLIRIIGEDRSCYLSYLNVWNEDIYTFVTNTGIKNIIFQIVRDVKDCITKLSEEVALLEKNKKDLLEL